MLFREQKEMNGSITILGLVGFSGPPPTAGQGRVSSDTRTILGCGGLLLRILSLFLLSIALASGLNTLAVKYSNEFILYSALLPIHLKGENDAKYVSFNYRGRWKVVFGVNNRNLWLLCPESKLSSSLSRNFLLGERLHAGPRCNFYRPNYGAPSWTKDQCLLAMGEGKVLWKPQVNNKKFQCELTMEKKDIWNQLQSYNWMITLH